MLSLCASQLLVFIGAPAASADGVGSGGTFVALPYSRLPDNHPTAPGVLAAGETRQVLLLGRNGIPTSGVGAVVLDITATTSTATNGTALTVWKSGEAQPTSPNLRVNPDSAPRSNTVIVAPGPDGRVAVRNSAGSTNYNIDIQGYFTAAPSESGAAPGGFVPVTPTTALDYVSIPAGGSRDISFTGVSGVPGDSTAVFGSISLRQITQDGALHVAPLGTDPAALRPIANYAEGAPNDVAAILKLGSGGVRILNASPAAVTVTVSVQGYFAAGSSEGGGLTTLTPTQVANVAVPAGATRNVRVAGVVGIPAYGVGGTVLHLTAKDPTGTGNGNLLAYRAGRSVPNHPVLGWRAEGPTNTTVNSAIVRPGDNGEIELRNTSTTSGITITVTVSGWFSAPALISATEQQAFVEDALAHGYSEDYARQAIYDRELMDSIVIDEAAGTDVAPLSAMAPDTGEVLAQATMQQAAEAGQSITAAPLLAAGQVVARDSDGSFSLRDVNGGVLAEVEAGDFLDESGKSVPTSIGFADGKFNLSVSAADLSGVTFPLLWSATTSAPSMERAFAESVEASADSRSPYRAAGCRRVLAIQPWKVLAVTYYKIEMNFKFCWNAGNETTSKIRKVVGSAYCSGNYGSDTQNCIGPANGYKINIDPSDVSSRHYATIYFWFQSRTCPVVRVESICSSWRWHKVAWRVYSGGGYRVYDAY